MNAEFRRKLAKDLENLTFASEIDAPFELLPNVSERSFSQFFAPLIRENKRMSDEERRTARRFRQIKGFIDANMKRKRVYLLGKINVEILIVGTDLSGSALIIKTKAIET